MASQKDIDIIRSATPEQYNQAWSLIQRGKESATRGDPVLAPLVNSIKNVGQEYIRAESKEETSKQNISKDNFSDPLRQQSVMPPQDKLTQVAIARQAQQQSEVQRYKSAGYSPSQSQALAQESVRQGGMSFTPDRTQEIIQTREGRFTRAKTSTFDFLTVGGTTAKKLSSKQIELNMDIEQFNLRYGGKELTKQEYEEALRKSKIIKSRQLALERTREEKIETPSYKVSSFLFGTFGRGALNPRLDPVTLEPIKVAATSVPITPIGTASLFGTKKLGFLGTQQTSRGATITKIVYSSKGRVGTAIGITQKEGGIYKTITAGQSGKVGYSLSTGTLKASRIQSFVGRGLSKQAKISYGKTPLTKTTGFVESITTKGRKIISTRIKFPLGTLVKKPVRSFKDLSKSTSLSYTTERVSLVAGKSTTLKGAKVNFKGLIFKQPQSSEVGKVFTGQTLKRGFTGQEQKAYSDVLATIVKDVPSKMEVVRPATSFVSTKSFSSIQRPMVSGQELSKLSIQKPVKVSSVSLGTTKIKEGTKIKSFTATTTIQKPITKIKTSTIMKESTAQIPKQQSMLIQNQKIIQKQIPKQVLITKQVPVRIASSRVFNLKPAPLFSFKIKKEKSSSLSFGKFPAYLRRFGEFKLVGYGRTPEEAFLIGKQAASKTLGATFKVPSYKGTKTKGFRTKKTKEGIEFIELPKYRLSTGTEKKEIQMFKKLKGGRKKKK